MLRLYSWRGMIVSLLILITILMICGVLYIKEYLTCAFEREPSAKNMETYTAVRPNPAVVSVEAAIPESSRCRPI